VVTHKLFLERMYGLLRREGRIGYIVPSGIYTDLGTKDLREIRSASASQLIPYASAIRRLRRVYYDSRVAHALCGR